MDQLLGNRDSGRPLQEAATLHSLVSEALALRVSNSERPSTEARKNTAAATHAHALRRRPRRARAEAAGSSQPPLLRRRPPKSPRPPRREGSVAPSAAGRFGRRRMMMWCGLKGVATSRKGGDEEQGKTQSAGGGRGGGCRRGRRRGGGGGAPSRCLRPSSDHVSGFNSALERKQHNCLFRVNLRVCLSGLSGCRALGANVSLACGTGSCGTGGGERGGGGEGRVPMIKRRCSCG